MKLYFQHEGPYAPEKVFKFNGGEMQVVLGDEMQAAVHGNLKGTMFANLRSSDDIMTLLILTDAIKRVNPQITMNLIIPYLPYARQDRVCQPGEALSVRVMADLINTMGYDEVIFHDPHSDVGVACVNNGVHWPVEIIMDGFTDTDKHNGFNQKIKKMTLIAPDAGAMKKVAAVAKYFEASNVIECGKTRNVKTGEITGTYLGKGTVKGKDLLIVDDICDGGMTFIKLAEALLVKKPKSISLYVTHGIFSKGLAPLFDAGISTIYTTDSFEQEDNDNLREGNDKLFVLNL